MNRHVLTIDLRDEPGVVETYREHHSHIWPEVARSLEAAGVRRMEIFLLGRRLVMILELEEGLEIPQVFERHLASGARVAEWERFMKSLQQAAPAAGPGEWWSRMERVFTLTPDTASAPDADTVHTR
jgi:L-rhamnose mutarotase